MLSIKPIVEIREGVVEEAGKVRTRSKALKLLADKVARPSPSTRSPCCTARPPTSTSSSTPRARLPPRRDRHRRRRPGHRHPRRSRRHRRHVPGQLLTAPSAPDGHPCAPRRAPVALLPVSDGVSRAGSPAACSAGGTASTSCWLAAGWPPSGSRSDSLLRAPGGGEDPPSRAGRRRLAARSGSAARRSPRPA